MIITPCKEISQEGRKKYAKEFERTEPDAYKRSQTVPVFKSWATKKAPHNLHGTWVEYLGRYCLIVGWTHSTNCKSETWNDQTVSKQDNGIPQKKLKNL